MRDIIVRAIKKIGSGEGGGHKFAAGAYVQKDKIKEFIDAVDSMIGEIVGS